MTSNKPHLPLTRIHTIMKSSSDAENISKESSQMMSKAAELFIQNFAKEAYAITITGKGKALDYKHLAEVVDRDDKYEFVKDIIPKKITVLEYKKILAKKNRSDNDDDDGEDESENDEDSEGTWASSD